MREIKFRAMWGGDWYHFTLDDITGCDMSGVGKPMLLVHLTESKWVTQFTGLLDKNGVEIYEGDLLSDKWRVEVFFKDGSFWVNTKRWIHNKMHLDDFLKRRVKAGVPAEVIGNIYENPELMS